MAIQPTAPADRQFIQSYGPGRFRVSGIEHGASIIVTPARTVAWSAPAGAAVDAALTAEIVAAAAGAEILLLGTGRRLVPLPRALRGTLRAAGMVADVMDTGAACRTYNLLVGEGRRVAAALVVLD
ncbi:MAG: Mth938-like domain-containing protein [Alphaproteobacteria bacterium]|nr:Mth938-like domain-containing protein [Alphaproteobacteria bacterium]